MGRLPKDIIGRNVAEDCRRLPTIADVCRKISYVGKLPKNADDCRRLPNAIIDRKCSCFISKGCRRLPTIAEKYTDLPKIAETCHTFGHESNA